VQFGRVVGLIEAVNSSSAGKIVCVREYVVPCRYLLHFSLVDLPVIDTGGTVTICGGTVATCMALTMVQPGMTCITRNNKGERSL
jgi:hypothetical protein